MVADALIYHPSVTHLLRYIALAAGRDKLMRTLQYFARFYAWYATRTNATTAAIAPWAALQRQMSLARKTLRLGKGLEHVRAAKVAVDKKGGDEFLRYCAVGRQVGYAGYLTLDTATYLDTAGIRPMASAKRLQKLAAQLWMAGLMFSTISGLYSLLRLRQQEERLDRKEAEGIVQSKRIQRDRAAHQIQLVSDLCDLTIPASSLGLASIDDGILGLAGTLSGVIGVWRQWKATATTQDGLDLRKR